MHLFLLGFGVLASVLLLWVQSPARLAASAEWQPFVVISHFFTHLLGGHWVHISSPMCWYWPIGIWEGGCRSPSHRSRLSAMSWGDGPSQMLLWSLTRSLEKFSSDDCMAIRVVSEKCSAQSDFMLETEEMVYSTRIIMCNGLRGSESSVGRANCFKHFKVTPHNETWPMMNHHHD